MEPDIHSFFHNATKTYSYLVVDRATRCAAIIDPVLDYNPNNGHTNADAADRLIAECRSRDLNLEWILETHAHADHVSAAQHIKNELGGRTGIGEGIRVVQKTFQSLFNLNETFKTDGSQFDHLFADDETFRIGKLTARVIPTPGHTNDSVSYLIGDAAFIGDTLFMPDRGTARCDFPGGDAGLLYDSVQRLYALPDRTRLFLCHDYIPDDSSREHGFETTVAAQKAGNIHAHAGVTRPDFIGMRNARDADLDAPRLVLPAIQINIRAGRFPPAEANGVSYLKIPLNAFGRGSTDGPRPPGQA